MTISRAHPPAQGLALVAALLSEAKVRGMDDQALASHLGLSATYWQAIRRRQRSIASFSRERLRKVANFLSISYVQALSMAELVAPEDFVVEVTLEAQCALLYQQLAADSRWSFACPPVDQWNATPLSTRVLVGLLYIDRALDRILASASKSTERRPVRNAQGQP